MVTGTTFLPANTPAGAGPLEQYTRLEERSRDVTARATWREPEWDLVVQGMFYELLQTQRDYALEFDPYYNTALEYKPYYQARGLVTKGFGEHVTVDGGVEARWLRDAADEGDFNHEFQRYFLTPAVQDLLLKGLSIGLTGEYWNSDDDIWTWGADVTQKVGKELRVSAGTVFSLYKYDYYAAEERDDVRTLYLRARYKLGSGLRLTTVLTDAPLILALAAALFLLARFITVPRADDEVA